MASSAVKKKAEDTKKNTSSASKSRTRTKSSSKKKMDSPALKVEKITEPAQKERPNPLIVREAALWLWLALCVFLFISYFGIGGYLGAAVCEFSFGILGFPAWLFPFLLFVSAAFWISNRGSTVARVKFGAAAALYLCACSFSALLTGTYSEGYFDLTEAYRAGAYAKTGGGVTGGIICGIFCPALGEIGAGILLIVLAIICLVLITQKSLMRSMQTQSRRMVQSARESSRRRKEAYREKEDWFYRSERLSSMPEAKDGGALPEGKNGELHVWDNTAKQDRNRTDSDGWDPAAVRVTEDQSGKHADPKETRQGRRKTKESRRDTADYSGSLGAGHRSAPDGRPEEKELYVPVLFPVQPRKHRVIHPVHEMEERTRIPDGPVRTGTEVHEILPAAASRTRAQREREEEPETFYIDLGKQESGQAEGNTGMMPAASGREYGDGTGFGRNRELSSMQLHIEGIEQDELPPETDKNGSGIYGGSRGFPEGKTAGASARSLHGRKIRTGAAKHGAGETSRVLPDGSYSAGQLYDTAEYGSGETTDSRNRVSSDGLYSAGQLYDAAEYGSGETTDSRNRVSSDGLYSADQPHDAAEYGSGETTDSRNRVSSDGSYSADQPHDAAEYGSGETTDSRNRASSDGSYSAEEPDDIPENGDRKASGRSYSAGKMHGAAENGSRENADGKKHAPASGIYLGEELYETEEADEDQEIFARGTSGTVRVKNSGARAETPAKENASSRRGGTDGEKADSEDSAEKPASGRSGSRAKRNSRSTQSEIEEGIASVEAEMAQAAKTVPREYVFPPVDLLKQGTSRASKAQELEIRQTAAKLQQTLDSFGVGVKVTNVSCGPSVTRYELLPEQGVKVSRIVALSDDIKLNLAAADIRIEAPIPGKSAVGIEVPNAENSTVALRELIESDEFQKHKSKLAFATGKDIGGRVVVSDIAKMPHLLIAGATGSGKSVCINTLIMSILYKAKPDEVKLIMIDPKVVELSVYNGIPHLFIPVVTDPKKAAGALNWAVAEMTDRYNKFAEFGVRDLKGYNQKLETALSDVEDENKPQKLPQIVIIVDELADLMMVAPGEVEDSICRLAQLARAAGIHLIIATQRPSVNVITGLIKANMPSRIAFSVSSGVDSRTIIDMNGAEKLLGKGDMLFYPQGYQKPARVQGAFVSDEEVSDVVDFLKEQNSDVTYDHAMQEQIAKVQQAAAATRGGEDTDELFADAGKFIIEKDKASIGMLQRVFKIGFNRAARIMDQLADAGVVGPEEGTKPRKILMSEEEFENYIEQN